MINKKRCFYLQLYHFEAVFWCCDYFFSYRLLYKKRNCNIFTAAKTSVLISTFLFCYTFFLSGRVFILSKCTVSLPATCTSYRWLTRNECDESRDESASWDPTKNINLELFFMAKFPLFNFNFSLVAPLLVPVCHSTSDVFKSHSTWTHSSSSTFVLFLYQSHFTSAAGWVILLWMNLYLKHQTDFKSFRDDLAEFSSIYNCHRVYIVICFMTLTCKCERYYGLYIIMWIIVVDMKVLLRFPCSSEALTQCGLGVQFPRCS